MPSEQTAIEWTDETWNPTHGCSKVSEGCANCYAARISQQYNHTEKAWTEENAAENVRLQEHHLDWPRGREPARIFVNSMSDLFHEQVPFEYLHRIMDVVEDCSQHAFIALTKHGTENGRLAEWDREHGRWPENLWMGVSVENQRRAYRIDQLLASGACVKWVSFEPLVGRVSERSLDGVDWVVIGGESGGADSRREMNHAWARSIRDMARDAGAAVYFKQSSGPRQGHQPVLAEAGPDVEYARAHDLRCSELKELPRLPGPLREARPDLADQAVDG